MAAAGTTDEERGYVNGFAAAEAAGFYGVGDSEEEDSDGEGQLQMHARSAPQPARRRPALTADGASATAADIDAAAGDDEAVTQRDAEACAATRYSGPSAAEKGKWQAVEEQVDVHEEVDVHEVDAAPVDGGVPLPKMVMLQPGDAAPPGSIMFAQLPGATAMEQV